MTLLGDKDLVRDLGIVSHCTQLNSWSLPHLVGGLEATEAGLDLWRGGPTGSFCLALLENVVPVTPEDLDLGWCLVLKHRGHSHTLRYQIR